MGKRVSEVITIDEIKKWNDGDIITISAGTGAGKSHFIKNSLYDFAKKNNKKILFLIHRLNCVNQFQLEIERDMKTDVIDIINYQRLESYYLHRSEFDFSSYQYIVCDEFHYFMSDASFNKTTDLSLNAILQQNDKTRIFMSATGDYMKRFINNYEKIATNDYPLPFSYGFIKALRFFNKDESLEQFIQKAIEQNIKTVFFIQSASKAYGLHKKFKNETLFNCSKSNDKYYKHVDENAINKMLENERFEKLILITTTTMDSGVNLNDEDLKYVVCDVKDIGTLIQCIGRKRLQNKNDCIEELYVKTISNQQLGGMETQLSKRIEMANYLRKNDVEAFMLKYPRQNDYSKIIYDELLEGEFGKLTKKVNFMMYSKCLIDIVEIQTMLQIGDHGYCKFLAGKFGFYNDNTYDYILLEEEEEKEELESYLDSIVGKKLFKEEQKKLIEKIDLRVDGRKQRSLSKLNEGLKMIKANYVIIKDRDSRRKMDDGNVNTNRNKTYWQVIKSLT